MKSTAKFTYFSGVRLNRRVSRYAGQHTTFLIVFCIGNSVNLGFDLYGKCDKLHTKSRGSFFNSLFKNNVILKPKLKRRSQNWKLFVNLTLAILNDLESLTYGHAVPGENVGYELQTDVWPMNPLTKGNKGYRHALLYCYKGTQTGLRE